MVILYISFPVYLEKQEKRGASVKIQSGGLSFKLADFSFARGQSWLWHWVDRIACSGSLEGFREKEGGERLDERLGRIFRTTHRPFLWVPYRLQYVALNKPPNKPRRRQWSVWYEEENNKATLFSVLVEFKPYENCLFLSFFRGIWIHAHM